MTHDMIQRLVQIRDQITALAIEAHNLLDAHDGYDERWFRDLVIATKGDSGSRPIVDSSLSEEIRRRIDPEGMLRRRSIHGTTAETIDGFLRHGDEARYVEDCLARET